MTVQANSLAGFEADALEVGDIVFIRIANFLYRRVAEATASWTSHVGYIHSRREDGEWLVAESAIPRVCLCPLSKFIARSDQGMLAVRRLKGGLSDAQKQALQQAAESRMGTLYHLGFKYDSPRQFCSKFVHTTYKEAVGVDIGQVETFRELLARNPESPTWFWRLWFWGFIPWNRRTVTPASQDIDPQLVTVFDNTRSEQAV